MVAARARKPKSAAVREAIADYEAKGDRLSPAEQQRLLAIAREIQARPPTRPQAEVRRELGELRRIRASPAASIRWTRAWSCTIPRP